MKRPNQFLTGPIVAGFLLMMGGSACDSKCSKECKEQFTSCKKEAEKYGGDVASAVATEAGRHAEAALRQTAVHDADIKRCQEALAACKLMCD